MLAIAHKNGRKRRAFALTGILLTAGLGITAPVAAQVNTRVPPPVEGAPNANVQHITVHSPAIEGNLEGDSADREVIVILPPGYEAHPDLRYPVLYALHGYSIGAEQWAGEIHVPQTIENAYAKGAAEMIVVMPDSKTVHNGSMYSKSQTTGAFETFIARDLVNYIDANYRTIPERLSRGLAGHSMGGYGASRIGMKHADTFGALYLMSPCCLSARNPESFDAETEAKLAAVKTPADSADLDFGMRAMLAMAAAFSPNPQNPPLYLDLPVENGEVRRDVLAKWQANAPLNFVDQYIPDLRSYTAIAMDVGDRDGLMADTVKLHEALDRYGIANSLEVYSGDHTSEVAYRMQDHVIPFFAQHLRRASSD